MLVVTGASDAVEHARVGCAYCEVQRRRCILQADLASWLIYTMESALHWWTSYQLYGNSLHRFHPVFSVSMGCVLCYACFVYVELLCNAAVALVGTIC